MKHFGIVLAAILALTLGTLGTAAAQPKGGRDGAQKQRHTSSQHRGGTRKFQHAIPAGTIHVAPIASTNASGGCTASATAGRSAVFANTGDITVASAIRACTFRVFIAPTPCTNNPSAPVLVSK